MNDAHRQMRLKDASRAQRIAIACAALLHAAAFAAFMLWIEPRPEEDSKVVVGVPEVVRFGTARTTDQAIRVGGMVFGCAAHAVAFSYSCPKGFEDGIPAKLTYFEMRTIESRLGLAEPSLVVVGIEQDGRRPYWKSPDEIRGQFRLTGLLVPLSLFGISFLLFLKSILKRRGK